MPVLNFSNKKNSTSGRRLRVTALRQLGKLTSAQMFRTERVIERLCKRGIDILAASIGLALLSPLLLFVAVLIKLCDGGPVLFWQTRIGHRGKSFAFPKFRSMVVDAPQLKADLIGNNDHGKSVTFKMKNDPRVTSVGAIIRRLSIDELPQLWCVLTGKMTLVGPRPPVPGEVDRYSISDRRRLEAIPGLTCIWQVSGRGEIPFESQVELDVEYIQRRTLLLDFTLLLRTVPAVVTGRGAY